MLYGITSKENFTRLYGRYYKPIRRYLAERLSDPATAEDLTQEVFLKVHRFGDSYDPKQPLSSWIWTIARNTLTDWYRRGTPGDHAPPSEELPSPEPHPEEHLDHKSRKQVLGSLLKSLTSLQRKVVILRVVHHLSYREIAEKLGLSLSAVKCLAYRSRLVMATMGAAASFL